MAPTASAAAMPKVWSREGICWEGINMAAGRKLDNLIVFADRNGWQSGGSVEDTIGDNNLKERFEAFGWHAQEIDGHDIDAIKAAIKAAKDAKGKPSVIVCDCVKGKGVLRMTTHGTKAFPLTNSIRSPSRN